MNTHRILGISAFLVGAATLAGSAGAQELTRAQVIAELHAAQAAGIVPHGDLDITARNGGPDDAPARTAVTTESRAQVQAELAQAIKDGDIEQGDSGRTLAELYPARYPQPAAAPGLTREQVKAQLAEAIRLGDIEEGDSGRTLAEMYPARYAAARAEAAAHYAHGNTPQAAPGAQVASK